MTRHFPFMTLVAVASVAMAAPLAAQQHGTVNSASLDAALSSHPSASHATLTSALGTPQAVATAKRLGMSQDELSSRIASLDARSTQQLADRILAGGSNNVVISTTAIIIVLLLLILLTR